MHVKSLWYHVTNYLTNPVLNIVLLCAMFHAILFLMFVLDKKVIF